MKQGILKLVKIAGGTQRDRADRFFLSASDREKSYESQIAATKSTKSTKSTSPTKIGGDKKDGKGFFGKTNDFLNSMISGGLTNLLIKGGIIATILYGIGKFFTSSEFRKNVSDMIGNLGKTLFGEEGWKDVKKNIATGAVLLLAGYVAIKASLMYLSAMITSAAFGIGGRRGIPGGPGRTNKSMGPMGKMFRGVGFAGAGLGLYNMFSGGDGGESSGLGGVAAAATGLAVGSALNNGSTPKTEPTKPKEQYRDPKTGRYAKAPDTKWSRFLVFLEKKSPLLFKKIGKRLLLAGAGLAVPGPGWIMTAISVLGSISLAWELYGWWKEFNDGSDNTSSNSPEKISSSEESTGMTGAETIRQLIGQSGGISLSGGANPDYYGNAGMTPPTSTSPLRMSPSSTSGGGDVDRVLSTIKGVESGGNYNAKNPNSSASGAYQFIDSTWQAATRKYGIGQEYKTARSAPPEIQDMVARKSVEDLLSKYNGDVDKVVNVWYTGNPAGNMTAAGLAANRGLTAEGYRARFEKQYNNSGGSLNQGSRQLSNSQNAPSGSPMVINAPTTNMNGGSGGSAINLPASGVIDNELAKLLVERAIG
jgi:hypothetical protein